MDQSKLREWENKCIQEELPQCTAACPLHVDARAFVAVVGRGDWPEGWKILRKTMPFPGILGRICDHPCQERCKRREAGGAIEIGALERACVETSPPDLRLVPLPKRGKTVGVVGTGLSSLTVAWDLGRKGYAVRLYEPAERLGGRLRSLPASLLSPEVIDEEVRILEHLDVQVLLQADVSAKSFPDSLLKQFDAVYLGLDHGVPPPERSPSADPELFSPSRPGLFAGGHSADGAGFSPIVWAYDGRRAAGSIDRFLQGASLTAGREKEGPQPTRLFVSLEGISHLPAVRPAHPEAGYRPEEAVEEAKRCLHCQCLECVKVCAYLERFGSYPKRYAREIYNNASIVAGDHKSNLLINSCSLCDLCKTVCPEDFSMADLCRDARSDLTARGKMPPSAHDFALQDLAFSRGDDFALARHEPRGDRSAHAFFPGCQLAASSPGQVKQVYAHLRKKLSGGVGLLLGCCGAPADWAGREDLFDAALAETRARWESLGRPRLLLACSTCGVVFKSRLPEAESASLWEVLEETGLPGDCAPAAARPWAVHDPCTTRHAAGVQGSVRRLLDRLGQPREELRLSGETAECCGFGGLMASANPELAQAVVRRRGEESASDYLAYCAMCRDSLASVGKRAVHLLDLIFPGEGDPASRRRPGLSERCENRARLKADLLRELWQEEGSGMGASERLELSIEPEVRERLDGRRILLTDVEQVVQHAERTGRRLRQAATGRLLASFRPRTVTFWVEYSPAEERHGFVVHNAYCHRMDAEGSGRP